MSAERIRRDRAELVEELNRLMAEEAEASLRYFQMRYRVRGKGRGAAERFFDEAIRETREHAEAIAQQIHALGHVPRLQIHLSLESTPMRPQDALAEALEIEQQALDAYKDLLPRVAGDSTLEPFIKRQVEVETDHVEELRRTIGGKSTLRLVKTKESS
jgi:bacterioferritin (cytochrome b1)